VSLFRHGDDLTARVHLAMSPRLCWKYGEIKRGRCVTPSGTMASFRERLFPAFDCRDCFKTKEQFGCYCARVGAVGPCDLPRGSHRLMQRIYEFFWPRAEVPTRETLEPKRAYSG